MATTYEAIIVGGPVRGIGHGDRVAAAGTPPVTRVVFHYPDDSVRISLKPAAGVAALYAPRRTVLDQVIADAAIEAGAEVRF